MKKIEIENEFYRIADILVCQGDTQVLIDLIPLEAQKSFIKSWHEGDVLDQ